MSGKYVGSNINESKPCSMLLTNHQYHALIKAQDLSLISKHILTALNFD